MKEESMNQSRNVFLVVVALLVIGGFGFVLFNSKPQAEVSSVNTNAPKLNVSYIFQGQTQNLKLVQVSADAFTGARFVTGAQTAPITVVEFSDYECPACGLFATEFESLFETKLVSSGKVRFAYRDFPLVQHLNANAASLAAACAADQGKFAEYKRILFRAQTDWSSSSATQVLNQFADYANQVGLDSVKLRSCINTASAQTSIDADVAAGKRVGITATPSFVINGFLVSGALPVEAFQAIIAKLEVK
jgi:protein-disulfide isomerase